MHPSIRDRGRVPEPIGDLQFPWSGDGRSVRAARTRSTGNKQKRPHFVSTGPKTSISWNVAKKHFISPAGRVFDQTRADSQLMASKRFRYFPTRETPPARLDGNRPL